MNSYQEIEKLYQNYVGLFKNMEELFKVSYDIDKDITKDNIKRLFTTYHFKEIQLFYFIKSFTIYYLVIFYFLLLSIFSKNEKKIKSDVIYELYDSNSFNTYFLKINSILNTFVSSKIMLTEKVLLENINLDIICRCHKYIYNKTISKLIFTREVLKFWTYYKLSKEYNIDVIDIILRQLKQIALFETQSQNIESKVLLSNGDNHFTPYRYFIYKKNGIKNIFLIQNGLRGQISELVPGNFYVYCDYYFAYGQKSFDVQEGMFCQNKIPIGSIQVSNKLESLNIKLNDCQIEYDIVFIEQIPIYDHAGFVLAEYLLMISHLCEFKRKYPQYTILYRTNIHKREMPEVKKEHGNFLDSFDKSMTSAGILVDKYINKDAYEAMFKSKLVVCYNSSMGTEALAMNKRVLYINYNRINSTFSHKEEIGVLIDKSYIKFEDKILMLLNKKDDTIDEYFVNLKFNCMNVNGNVSEKISSIIKNLIEEEK